MTRDDPYFSASAARSSSDASGFTALPSIQNNIHAFQTRARALLFYKPALRYTRLAIALYKQLTQRVARGQEGTRAMTTPDGSLRRIQSHSDGELDQSVLSATADNGLL